MKPLKQLKRLLLLLCLIVGAQSAWAQDWGPDWQYCNFYRDETSNGISYYLYHTSTHKDDASLHAITATGDVVVPYMPCGARLFSIGYWPDQDKSEDVTVTSDMTSLTFNAHVNIHGTFTLENLHGPLTFYGPANNPFLPGCIRCTTVKMGSTLNIPRATALSIDCFQVDGTVNAPAITNVTFTPNTVINGTFTANNATAAILKGTIAGTVNLGSVTLPVFRWNGGDCKITGSGHVNVPAATKIHIESGYGISGEIYAPSATEVNLDWGSHFANYGSIYAPAATAINIESGDALPTEFYGKITSNKLTSISLGYVDFGSTGKLDCSKLTDIYIPDRYRIPVFTGAYSNHFTVPSKTITVHVYDMSPKEISAMKSSPTWDGFNIVNHQSDISYTLISDGNASATLYDLNNYEDFAQATNVNQIAQVTSGSRSGTMKAGHNYAVVVEGADWDHKKVTLNGTTGLTSFEDQGVLVKYRNYPDLTMGSRFEVCVSDKTCDLQISQQRQCVDTIGHYNEEWNFNYVTYTNRYGKINYTKYLDGTTTNGSFQSETATITGSQGSMFTLSIPYNEYCPDNLMVDGTLVPFEMSEGVATASFRLPSSTEQITTCNASLKWKKAPKITVVEPVPEGVEVGDTIVVRGDTIVVDGPTMVVPARHQPQMMVMRSGDGDVLLKGMCNPDIYGNESWAEQIRDAYEQEFGYPADEYGIVVNAVANCVNPVTTLTVPNIDYLGQGGEFDATDWGFQADITPVAGQTLKTLLVGWIIEEEGRQLIEWEDILHGVFSNYVKYNEATNTYTFNWGFDEMNVWIGDYVINVGMGPEESTVETGKTLSFVRKGGRGNSHIEWYDYSGRDFSVGEGSSSRIIPNEELQDDDLKMYIDTEEGETFHVYKNGVDITDQFQLNGQSTTEYWAPLEAESATYTLLIEDAPDANPTWTIQNATEADVLVVTNYKDGTTGEDPYSNSVNKITFDDSQINKVTLRVYAENQNDSKPVRILKNGVDVSYQFTVMDPEGDALHLCYEVPVNLLTDCAWNISYDTDHKQTYIVRGGTREPAVEVEHEHLYGSPTLTLSPNEGPTSIYFAPYDGEYNSYINTTVYVNDGETAKIVRNGWDITKSFTIQTTSTGKRYYELEICENNYSGNNSISVLGFDIREAATWEITIENPHKMLNAYANNDVSITFIKMVDGEVQSSVARENSMHCWVNEGETYEVKFIPKHGEELTRFDIGWNAIDIENDSRLVKNDDGSYSFTISYDEMNEKNFDIMAVFGGATTTGRTMLVSSAGSKWVKAKVTHSDGTVTSVGNPIANGVVSCTVGDGDTFEVFASTSTENPLVAVKLNGVDVTNNTDYLKQKDDLWWNYNFSSVSSDAVIELVYAISIYDVNRDNNINISDVTKLVNKILEKNPNDN